MEPSILSFELLPQNIFDWVVYKQQTCSHYLKVRESRIKVSAGVVSGEDPLPALWVTVFLLYPQWMKREENSLGSA